MRCAITTSAAANRLECHMHLRAGQPPGKDDAVPTMIVVLNWLEELKQRVTMNGK
jgi:hypothetical protein